MPRVLLAWRERDERTARLALGYRPSNDWLAVGSAADAATRCRCIA